MHPQRDYKDAYHGKGATRATRAFNLMSSKWRRRRGPPACDIIINVYGSWLRAKCSILEGGEVKRDNRRSVVSFQFNATYEVAQSRRKVTKYVIPMTWLTANVMLLHESLEVSVRKPLAQGDKEMIFRFVGRGDLPCDPAGRYHTHKFASVSALLSHIAIVPVEKRANAGWVISPGEMAAVARAIGHGDVAGNTDTEQIRSAIGRLKIGERKKGRR
jgi:hypothetical protein